MPPSPTPARLQAALTVDAGFGNRNGSKEAHTYELERPRDFEGRFVRRAPSIGRRPLRLRRRVNLSAAALAAIALPAFAQPGGWDRFAIADAATAQSIVAPMPFEQAGASFPGSAFYYLDSSAAPLRVGEGIRSDADDVVSGPVLDSGTVARPLVIFHSRADNSGVDRGRALQCLTAAIYYEAASEADAGQRAVAQVVLNRVAHPAYPKTVCGVVYEGSERSTGCQFSFTCDGSLARRPQSLFWNRAEQVARAALTGQIYAPVGLATHYHTVQVHPYWAPSLRYLGTIGAHRFYSFKGTAGQPATFRYAYFGGEPAAAPHRRDNSPRSAAAAAALDPLAVQRAFEGTALPTEIGQSAASLPSPVYTSQVAARGGDSLYRAQNLSAQGIKAEYANSGAWIADPRD